MAKDQEERRREEECKERYCLDRAMLFNKATKRLESPVNANQTQADVYAEEARLP